VEYTDIWNDGTGHNWTATKKGGGTGAVDFNISNFSGDLKLNDGMGLTATGAVTGSNLNVANWDTAYGWGDHASGGYADGTNEAHWDTTRDRSIYSSASAASGDLNVLTAESDEGWLRWGGTQPTTGSPGFQYAAMLTVRDDNQNLQLAFGGRGHGFTRLAVRRADSGVLG